MEELAQNRKVTMKQTFTYRETGRTLSAIKGNRVRLALAFAMLLLSVLVPFVIAVNLNGVIFGTGETLSEEEMLLSNLVFFGVWLILGLLTTPFAVTSFYRYGYRLYCATRDAAGYGGDTAKGSLWGNWLFGLSILIRPGLCAIPIALAFWVSELTHYWLHVPMLALAVAFCVLWMRCTAGSFLVPYRMCRGDRFRAALRNSRKQIKGKRKLYGRYISCFFLHGLLSVLTVGVWLVFHTLPNLIFTYFALADSIDGKENS